MEKFMEQPKVGLKCLYLLLNPPNIFELLISVGLVSISTLNFSNLNDSQRKMKNGWFVLPLSSPHTVE